MAVAPEVPAAGLFVVGLAFAMTALFLVFLRFGAVTLVGGTLRFLAGLVSWLPFVGHFGEDAVNAGVNYVDDLLGKAVHAAAGTSVTLLDDSWKLTKWVGDAMADLATSTEHALSGLVTHTIPHAVHSATSGIVQDLTGIDERIARVEREALAEVKTGIDQLTRQGERLTSKLEHRVAAAETAIAGTLGGELAHVEREALHGIEALRDALTRRLSRVEKLLGIAALTGTIIGVIARHLPWLRCTNVGKVGKHLCGLPVSQLDNLLAQAAIDGLAILGTVSLVEFAEAMQAVVGEVAQESQTFWRAA